MVSTKEDETSMLDALFGSISLGGSVGKKDNETEVTEPAKENGTEKTLTKKLCSACGKKSDTLKKCNGCLCVWYCDKKCQNKHRKEHKKECRPIKKELDKRGGKLNVGNEMDIGPLGKVPPREECPICMQVLPIHGSLHTYFPCCGKIICCGCDHQHSMKCGKGRTCAFCREPLPKSDDENLARLSKRVELKDQTALCNMALYHGHGHYGLPVDQAKCIDLLREAANHGCPAAHYQLGIFYQTGDMGLEQNEEEALRYFEEAAEGGKIRARYNVGCAEYQNGDYSAAMRHFRLSAAGGSRRSVTNLIVCFENGDLHHQDLAETLQAMYRSRAEMKSEDRDQFIKLLKETGEYQEEYDV